METHPDNKCSNCGNKLDAALALNEEQVIPKDGDISVCAYCGQLGVYEEGTKIRKMREDEIYTLFKEQPETANTIRQIQSVYAFVLQGNKKPTEN